MSGSHGRSEDPGSTGPRTGRFFARCLQITFALVLFQVLAIQSARAHVAPHADPSRLWVYLLTVIGLFIVHALFAAAETALRSVSRARMTTLSEEGSRRAGVVLRLLEHPATFLTAIQVLKTILTVSIALTAYPLVYQILHLPQFERFFEQTAAGPVVGVVTVVSVVFLLLLFGEIIPKVIASQHPDRVALFASWWIGLFTAVIYPLFRLIDRLSTLFVSREGQRSQRSPMEAEEEIKIMAAGGVETGEIEPQEQEMIRGVLTATDKVAREVMVPRIDITAVDIDGPIQELVDAVLMEGHSRIPVYEENIDHIVGVVHARDLIKALKPGGLENLRTRDLPLREPNYIPESKRLLDLLSEFRIAKMPFAIVVDEYGGTSGIVTMEDLLEEIVGEIMDESDIEEEPYVRLDDQTVVFASRVPIDDVNEVMKIHLPEEEFDTLGGFVFGQTGEPPAPGQTLQYNGVVMTVEDTEGHRIQRIRVYKIEEPEEMETASARSES
ncbi:MAG: hemolysin family protein [Armatimonadetes bacterium]|nr:hemolysin family protein [Armatimonadota bacterium]